MPPRPAPDTCWCYLIRHGATANNVARPPRLQGRRSDPGLSDEGREQVRRTARLLDHEAVAAVYSSPLLRARQTAEAIAGAHGLGVQIVEDLVEIDVGQWEGLPWDQIEKAFPEAARMFLSDASVHPYLGGENLGTVQARVVPAMERLLSENLSRTIVVIAHNVVNRAYLAHLAHMPLAQYRVITQDNCGVNLLRYRDGQIKLITLNAVGHLEHCT